MSAWRLMHNAPVGEWVLAYDVVGGQYIVAIWNGSRGEWQQDGGVVLPSRYLSHWMHLPPPPSDEEE